MTLRLIKRWVTTEAKRLAEQLEQFERELDRVTRELREDIALPPSRFRGIIDSGLSPFALGAGESVSVDGGADVTVILPAAAKATGRLAVVNRRSLSNNVTIVVEGGGGVSTGTSFALGGRGPTLFFSDGERWWPNGV